MIGDQEPTRSPEPIAVLDGRGESCATFTPVIAARMRDLGQGAVLEVISDDETAAEALGSWARLTGNELLEMRDEGAGGRRFVLRRHR
jgi:TusA-related sulfurtransferase